MASYADPDPSKTHSSGGNGQERHIPIAIDRLINTPRRLATRVDGRLALLPPVALRFGVVFSALAILIMRMPTTFLFPQFWGEDGAIFFLYSRLLGWESLTLSTAGYLCVVPWLTALAAGSFDPHWAPALYNGVAILLTLLVVWLATSPRFDMPYRPLLALAVVLVPAGYEVLLTIANAQWILPVGVLILTLMRPARSSIVLMGEAVFVAMTAFNGPFSIFLTPLLVVRLFSLREDSVAWRRMLLFAVIVFAGATLEGWFLFSNRDNAFSPWGLPKGSVPWEVWANLPFSRITQMFGGKVLFQGQGGVIAAAFALALAAFFAFREPYRTQKLSMAYLGLAIMFAGMIKYRGSLMFVGDGSTRYFYACSIFVVWFVCVAAKSVWWRNVCAGVIAVAEIASLLFTVGRERNTTDLEWGAWAAYVGSGLPLTIPTPPVGWYINLPADPDGPLARYAAWVGKPLGSLVESRDDHSCSGLFTEVSPAPLAEGKWIAKGWQLAGDQSRPLVAVVDGEDRILGFGFPGFRVPATTPPAPEMATGWTAIFPGAAGAVVRAYDIVDGRRACPLANEMPLKP